MRNSCQELLERIRGEVSDLDRVVNRAWLTWNRSKKLPNEQEVYIDSVALNLHSIYSGLERIFELIARHVGEKIPSGELWHRDLLKQMSQEQKDLRPAVISADSFFCLDEMRRFRHLVRNVYTFNLVPEKVEPIVTDLVTSWSKVQAEILAFADFIEQSG